MINRPYGQDPYYRQPLYHNPYLVPGFFGTQFYTCPYLNQVYRPNGIGVIPKPTIPIQPEQMLAPPLRAKRTIEAKWNSLGGAPGAAISDVESVGPGFRIRYQNGAIYTKISAGPAFWVHGAIGDRYNALGGVGSWLGFPITDELPLEIENGRISRFENGEIYWWQDTGAIEINNILLAYKGINCFGTTSGLGSDEVYATIGVIAPTGDAGQPVEIATALTRLYTDVDGGESIPDYIELYRGKPYGMNITFMLLEHDEGDPNKYYGAVVSAVEAASGLLTAGIGAITGPAAAVVAAPILQSLVPVISKGVNELLGTGDDVIGNITIPLTLKQVIVLAARTGQLTEKQIQYNLATPLLTGDGGSYKGYFSFSRA